MDEINEEYHGNDVPTPGDQNDSSNLDYDFISPNQDIQSNSRRVRGDPNHVVVPPLLDNETPYDQNLTAAHQYLGDGLSETTGRTVFEENVIHTLPVIFLELNLMPGQILPIIARSKDIKMLLRYSMSKNRAFGVSYELQKETFGTIAEVFEQSTDIETSQSFQVKAMGHQRYKIINIKRFPGSRGINIGLAEIKIIPDTTLTQPFNMLCLNPRNRNLRHNDACRKKDMWLSPWPSWVINQFDSNHLASILKNKIKMLYKDVKVLDDPYLLSFQVLRLGIFRPRQVSKLLGISSTNERLKQEIREWNDNQSTQKFICNGNRCKTTVCNMSSVFPMSAEGPQGSYCNSWGQIHNMITVTELDRNLSVGVSGTPSTECTWFPGYKWTIILCPYCGNHLGWRYNANENSRLVPSMFYGLTMRSIKPIAKWNTELQDLNREITMVL